MEWVCDKESLYLLASGEKVWSVGVHTDTVCGEYITVDGKKVCVKAEIPIKRGEHDTITFSLWGLYEPQLRVTTITLNTMDEFRADRDAPRIFERKFKKYLNCEPFKTEIGKMFLERLGECLNYRWCG